MMTASELREAIRKSELNTGEIAVRAQVAKTTLYSFVIGDTKNMRHDAHQAVELVLRSTQQKRANGFAETKSNFNFDRPSEEALRKEAMDLGLDVQAIARKALNEEVKRARIAAWIADNKEAFEANRRDIEKNGLWSDELRQF